MSGTTTIIVPVSAANAANAAMKILDPDTGGDKTFIRGLSVSGSTPITHYIASGTLDDAAIMALASALNFWSALQTLAAARSRTQKFTQVQANAAYAVFVFGSGSDPRGTMIANNLKMVDA